MIELMYLYEKNKTVLLDIPKCDRIRFYQKKTNDK